jgi:hypothetical protein
MTKRIKYTKTHPYSNKEHLCCPFCGTSDLSTTEEVTDSKLKCDHCEKDIDYDPVTHEFILPDGPMIKGELVNIKGEHTIEIMNQHFKFKILSDAIGDHPGWFNDKYTILADLELEGTFGLFIDINTNDMPYLHAYTHHELVIPDFETYKQLVIEKINELLQKPEGTELLQSMKE